MTPAELGAALAAVAGGALAPRDVPLSVRGPGVYATSLALRLRLDPQVTAERVRALPGVERVEGDGMLVIAVDPARVVSGVLAEGDAYAAAEVPQAPWKDGPRVFGDPGFEVRYAYARAAWVGRWAEDLHVEEGPPAPETAQERRFTEVVADLPCRARQAEREQDPRPFALCLERLAAAYHDVHERCPALPKGDEKPGAVHAARVTLARAARIALGNGLKTIGETPRERI
ncbi:DALR anticodon-binding domain-containing protein [Actinomadura atramentaria]|uniref:DALR anticodon-binding domain-containing protein n=1 Tax=Actinomadura atramentaria TaxID=1990 RepID=UPI00036E5EE6|nr:DALR anticodon-binding domain-containing protein [Actinomadura atramentaria]